MTRDASLGSGQTSETAATDRLDSWKDVAAYLKRDVSTVQRWERREGLPIHRQQHDKLGSVYAFRHEIDAWRATRARLEEPPPEASTRVDKTSASEPDTRFEGGGVPGPGVSQSQHHRSRRFAVMGIVAVVVTALIGWSAWRLTGTGSTGTRPEIRSIVVLPLDNLSGDVSQEYFAAGLTEEITARLAQLKNLRVVSRTSAVSLRGRKVPVLTIARELDVDGVVEGSVRREGGRVRISIQLIDARTDTHLWARDFERNAAATWRLQVEVAQAVADEIRIQATPEERARLATVPAVSPAAHNQYLLGRHLLWKFIEEDRVRAIDHILLANPNPLPAEIQVRFLKPGFTVTRSYTLTPFSRRNIWVNGDVRELGAGVFSANVQVLNYQPIAVEKALYWSASGEVFAGGTNVTATRMPPP